MQARAFGLPLFSLALMATAPSAAETVGAPTLSYFGRSSFRIATASGFVVYVDPYAPGDYSSPADLVLVSHGHGDHNAVDKVTRKSGCLIVAPAGAVEGHSVSTIAEGQARTIGPVSVRAVAAANSNHPRGFGVGYILTFDGIVLYYSGDTSRLPEMAEWKGYGIDYALICSDGHWNMNVAEAAQCATLMGAKRLVPVHTSAEGLYDEAVARSAKYPEALVVAPGSVIGLKK
ncbi:MAG TPA: MBL fold metallo-hydrolase [Rectinemataceae bacterium]|nr:MBL fold metallo-hydrolase [Rectinemataceae bacterium]